MNALMNFLDLANYPIPEPVRIGIFVALLTGLALLVLDTVVRHRRQLKRKTEILRWRSALDASRQQDDEWEIRSSPQAIEAMEIRLSQNDCDD